MKKSTSTMSSLDSPQGARFIARRSLLIFLPVFAVIFLVIASILFVGESSDRLACCRDEQSNVGVQVSGIVDDIQGITADLAILRNETMGARLWRTDGEVNAEGLFHLANQYLSFSTHRELYDQIRLLDEEGMEIVRVNFNNRHPTIVPEEQLQNKRGRYYFDDAFKLSVGEVFVSPLDLNVENGEIEHPLKPMIRFATPVFDQAGKKRGVILFNYLGERLIDRLVRQGGESCCGQTMLLNMDGYWLDGPFPEDRWGFMYEDRKDRTFGAKFPEAWEIIRSGKAQQFETSQGLFTYETVCPLLEELIPAVGMGMDIDPGREKLQDKKYYWTVVSYVPKNAFYRAQNDRREYAALIFGLLIMGLLAGSWRIAEVMAFRKRATRALRDSEERFKHIAESMSDWIWEVDVDGVYTYCSSHVEEVLGYRPEEIVGKTPFDFMVPADRDRLKCLFEEIIKEQRSFRDLENCNVSKTGQRKCLLTSGTPIFSEDGAFLGYRGVNTDISDRRRAEWERTRLLTAIQQAGETIVITDTKGDIEYVNPTFEKITGYTSEEAMGQNPRLLNSGEQSAEFYREMWDVILSGKTWNGRFVNRKKNGTLYTEDATISPVVDASGRTINYVAVKRDVTHEIEMEEQFRQAQKMQSVGQLVAGIAHDFNNLMQVINGYAYIAQGKLGVDHAATASIDAIAQAGQDAKTLVQQLLAFSRQQVIDPVDFDLNELIQNSWGMLRHMIGEHIQFELVAGDDLGTVFADKGQMHQVLMNLCVNARDAMPGGGVLKIETKKVQVTLEQTQGGGRVPPGKYALLCFTDTGYGMNKEMCKKIFEPFFTTKEVGKGTGLGLSTVYGIVKQNDGVIEVDSELGKGTTFRIYLPVSTPLSKAAVELMSESARAVEGGIETILVVEDDAVILDLATHILSDAGYTVLSATDGEEAVRVFEEQADEIDCVMMDVVMPRMGGKDAMEKLLKIRPALRHLFVSGYSPDAGHTRFIKEKDFNLLSKPYQSSVLLQKIRDVLDEE